MSRRIGATSFGVVSLVPLAVLAAACGGSSVVTPAPSPRTAASAPPPASAQPPADPLGPPPAVAIAPPFQPPAPAVYTTANGVTVWLLERHALPVVAITVVVPSGSASDPKGQAGLADETAQMLTEGAGKRGALEFARAVDDLGAQLDAGVSLDTSAVHLTVVKRNLAAGMALLGDAIVRPRWDAGEWKRVHDLWTNELKERASDPDSVANVVEVAVLYGADHPYGHPVDGLVTSAPRVQLAGAQQLWAQVWRPERATVVVVGDVTKAELDPLLESALGGWKAAKSPALPIVTPPPPPAVEPAPTAAGGAPKTKVVIVDRPEAPQVVVRLIRGGVAASDPRLPALRRANIALGGSFTSRLNHDLREVRGWTYGASSWVAGARGVGTVGAGAAFVLDKGADALKAMLADVNALAHSGLTDEEADKTRMQARSDVVGEYETVERTSRSLAYDAALGLGPDYAAKASVSSDEASRAKLNELAATFFDLTGAIIVAVGPRAKLEGALTAAGFGPFEYRDAEGALKATKRE